jgi:hypothetical protein
MASRDHQIHSKRLSTVTDPAVAQKTLVDLMDHTEDLMQYNREHRNLCLNHDALYFNGWGGG